MIVGIGRIRHALGDGATEDQARRIHRLLRDAGLLQPPHPGPLVGIGEVAELAGVAVASVCQWRNMPEPVADLKATPVWLLADVQPRIDACIARRERKNART